LCQANLGRGQNGDRTDILRSDENVKPSVKGKKREVRIPGEIFLVQNQVISGGRKRKNEPL